MGNSTPRELSPMRTFRDFLRSHPAYTNDAVVELRVPFFAGDYSDRSYGNRDPSFAGHTRQYISVQPDSSQQFVFTSQPVEPLPWSPKPEREAIPEYDSAISRIVDEAVRRHDYGLPMFDEPDAFLTDTVNSDPNNGYTSVETTDFAMPGDILNASTADDSISETHQTNDPRLDDILDAFLAEQSPDNMMADTMDYESLEDMLYDSEMDDAPEPEPMEEPMM